MAAAAEEATGAGTGTGTGTAGFQWSLEAAAEQLGASEAALKLFVSIILGYPFAFFHRRFLHGTRPHIIHFYNTILGLWIAYFNFGWDMCHSLVCVIFQFLALKIAGRTITGVATSFIFQMTYLLAGYFCTATDQYDIKWTMPHCVLALKMIGLAFDYYDGGKDKAELSKEQESHMLDEELSLAEVAGFAYFYGGFLVGPQFAMRSYLKMVTGQLTDVPSHRPNSVLPAMRRLALGMAYVTVYMLAKPYFPDDYFLTNEFANQSLGYKCLYIAVWGKVTLNKYVTCWLIAEGVCVMTGLAYNGRDAHGEPQWDACTNIRVRLFETTLFFKGTIAAFNIQTNQWASRHIFKRLKFLGNKMVSQGLTLLFLAVWHGLHSGYFMCFFMEFVIVYHENQVIQLVEDSPLLRGFTSRPELAHGFYLLQQCFHWLFMGYPLVPFCLFAWEKWVKVYKSVYFVGHVIFFSQILLMPLYRKLLLPKKHLKLQ